MKRRLHYAAGVVAEIEHQAFQFVAAQAFDGFFQLRRRFADRMLFTRT